LDSPANSKVVVSDEAAASLTYGAEVINGLKMLNPAAIIDNREAWLDRWNEKVVN
jgi:putative spermidine/putrescine transport system substrate-binding protein